ncbi:uncharacterized protein LOC102043645 [Geospiza fortis]|uniref:Uncharacterized protein LOC102043645 n=1 Tax=Geospiza fortis TaxID=48883 RepID=A0A6I9HNS0_GEOFO|nr:uncharacterized protein LOC102043645 [Geospiza fortis]
MAENAEPDPGCSGSRLLGVLLCLLPAMSGNGLWGQDATEDDEESSLSFSKRLLHGYTVWEKTSGSTCLTVYYLAGGNQRELARQKNLKKTQEIHKGKRKEDRLSASQRKQRDTEIMQQKQKAANERKSLQAGAK